MKKNKQRDVLFPGKCLKNKLKRGKKKLMLVVGSRFSSI